MHPSITDECFAFLSQCGCGGSVVYLHRVLEEEVPCLSHSHHDEYNTCAIYTTYIQVEDMSVEGMIKKSFSEVHTARAIKVKVRQNFSFCCCSSFPSPHLTTVP